MELGFIKDMFNSIAPRYDFLNRLLSLRQDVRWRRQMIKATAVPEGGRVLDAACGTGDVVTELVRNKSGVHAVGIDFAPQMLVIARQKIKQLSPPPAGTDLLAANVLALPFARQSFDAITIAFGIRNIMDRKAALREFYSHLKPGGTLAVLELATPKHRLPRYVYLAYFEKILPAVGAFFSKNHMAYRYLPASVIRFPEPEAFAGLMEQAGFVNIRWKALTLGLATLYTGIKKERNIS
ncbi:MAG: bifunctional demethylmenaquinone methyltransferase/2-methoxy-6-polyprenyl-1,4-benzoquinol methylase UbiE [Desulfosalsimonadaceae bacterium]